MHDKSVIKKRVIESAESHGVESLTDEAYSDLMQNIEYDVQQVLREEGIIGNEE